MNLVLQFSATFAYAAVLAVCITWVVRRMAIRFGVLDRPDSERKIHEKPKPLWGGVAVYATAVFVVVTLYAAGWLTDDRVSEKLLIGLLSAGAVLVFGGTLDDRYTMSWWQQLVFPIAAAAIMLASGLEISFITNPFGSGLLQLNEWQIPLASREGVIWYFAPVADVFLVMWILGMIYTTKLLDGIDGLTSSISLVAALVIFIVSLSWDRTGSTTSFLALTIAGAALGFLMWNWHPAKIFLGEAGSTFFGFMLAVLAVISGGKIATALLVMGIPIMDVARIIVRRVRSGSKIYHADTQHLHFRLLRAGLSQQRVVIVLAGLSLLFGSIAFFFTTRGKVTALVILVAVMIALTRILFIRYEKKAG